MRQTPRFLRILGQRIRILSVVDLLHDDEDGEHVHRAYGVFDPGDPVIWLDKASGIERRKVTLIHEGLHAMLNTAKIDEVGSEEELVGRLAPVLLDFIRANKGAIAYLQES